MTEELSFPRHFGEYVLVAQLGEDGLGTVYRALASKDERRFMRLRILQSAELAPEDVASAIRENALRATSLVHKAIVPRAEMGVLEGVPFLAWYEGAGWTLDVVLARLRATGTLVPTEYALLIAERVAAALAYACVSVEGEPFHHGLLWPGFVAISNDAEVRVGGFGLAAGILPSLHKPRLLRDIAPYLPPEVREKRRVTVSSDVYSLGVLLLELLTGRRPSLEPQPAALRAADPFAEEVGAFLRSSLVEPSRRFFSVAQMHRAIQELLASSPYALSTASLAVFLYKLLNPESRALPATDGESTNPVSLEALPSRVADSAAALPQGRATPLAGERRQRRMRPLHPSTTHVEISFPNAPDAERTAESAGDSPSSDQPETLDGAFEPPPQGSDASRSSRRRLATVAAAVAASIALIAAAGAFFVRGHKDSSVASSRRAIRESAGTPRPAPVAVPSNAPPEQKPTSVSAASPGPSPGRVARRRAATPSTPAATATDDVIRKSVETWRLAAALARIEAERLEAAQLAADAFLGARSGEQEGERLFGERDWASAQTAFERAASLFRRAEGIAREERVRRVKPAPSDSPQ